jgi:hypothetical protein
MILLVPLQRYLLPAPLGEKIQPDGLVLLGPSAVPGEGRMSGPYSRMTVDPIDIFKTVQTISAYAENLTEWLIMHDYLLRAFGKFKTDTVALQKYAETYIESLSDDRFFVMFRSAVERTRILRCIFGSDDAADSDHALEQHISGNALGDGYTEEMIANVPVGHIDLKTPSVVLSVVEDIVRRNN